MITTLRPERVGLTILVLVAAASQAPALTMVAANLGAIVENTEAAFVGTVTSVETIETPQGWADRVTVQISQKVLGEAEAGQEYAWTQIRMGKDAPLVGMPQFEAGEEWLLFIAPKAEGSPFQAPVALGQGAFRIHRDSETGAVYARNEFMNSNLTQDLDEQALAEAVAQVEQSKLRALGKRTTERVAPVSLSPAVAGATSLDAIVKSAQTLALTQQPSKAFFRPESKDAAVTGRVIHYEPVAPAADDPAPPTDRDPAAGN